MRGTDFIGDDQRGCKLERDDLLLLLGQRKDLRSFAQTL